MFLNMISITYIYLLLGYCYVWTSSMQRCSVVRTDTDLVHSLYIVSSLCSGEDRLSLHWPGLVYTFTGMGQYLALAGGTHSYPYHLIFMQIPIYCLRTLILKPLVWRKRNERVGRDCRSWMIILVCEKLVFIRNWLQYVYWELIREITSLLYWMLSFIYSCGSSVRSIFHWLVGISWARSRGIIFRVVISRSKSG